MDATAATVFTAVQKATAAALVVGRCATALGPQSSTGAMTATVVAVRPAPAGGCTTGFAGGRFGGGRFGGGRAAA
ncbi:MAG: hypothetical protein M0Z63_05205 [Actinomycetota bacterium]|nr:hypothetical protein [Actinomycetota bacterium]